MVGEMSMQIIAQKMLIGGIWVERERKMEVRNPENGGVLATVPAATKEDVKLAIHEAKEGLCISANLPVHRRMEILQRAVNLIEEKKEMLAKTIAMEGSKTIREARKEVRRCKETLQISAEEARRIKGETIPFSQMPGHERRVGYYYRFPIGIIAAITPFNDPLNLVAHKVGPAIASGNVNIVKPSSLTPLSAFLLAEIMEEAGLPPKILSVITGHGSEIGDELVANEAVRFISFTGGYQTGERIAKVAGVKKMAMELGSNSPTIILKDANVTNAVESTVSGAFSAVGQNCIGVQRIYVQQDMYNRFLKAFILETNKIKMGPKLEESTDIGPLISEKEAIRIENLVKDAIGNGAVVHTGGKRKGAYYLPTILSNVSEQCEIAREEVFGPVVILSSIQNIEEAVEKANGVGYGLHAGVFTESIEEAFYAIHHLEVGGIMINDSSDVRIDEMPFGGVKRSGLGREGVKYAIDMMTEEKVVSFKLGGI